MPVSERSPEQWRIRNEKESELHPLCTQRTAGPAADEQGEAPGEDGEDEEQRRKESAAVIKKHLQRRVLQRKQQQEEERKREEERQDEEAKIRLIQRVFRQKQHKLKRDRVIFST